jgi:hypothetical protein
MQLDQNCMHVLAVMAIGSCHFFVGNLTDQKILLRVGNSSLFLVNLPYLFLFLLGEVADQFLLLQLFSCHRLLNKIFLLKAFHKFNSSFFKDYENLGVKPSFPVPDVGPDADPEVGPLAFIEKKCHPLENYVRKLLL